ncbi:MAG: group II intron maturase-specific domain-containing protein [Calothrix sp. MO_192.B10]|nr:group II intron maturase-specific domain-containing protein [Calothrix sp. MO_192.B10]
MKSLILSKNSVNGQEGELEGKLLIKPQKEKVLLFCKKVGNIIKNMSSVKQETLIKKLNPILQGFANYYQGVVSKQTFGYISYRVWKYLWAWCKRRHHKRRYRWVKNKYFHQVKGIDWIFCCITKDRRGEDKNLSLFQIGSTPITRHIKVKGEASPFNTEFAQYWESRQKQLGKKRWAKGSKYEQIAKNQDWKCPICGEALSNGEEIETHHVVPVKNGGTDKADNLIHLHKACHKQVHSKSKRVSLEVWLEPCNG